MGSFCQLSKNSICRFSSGCSVTVNWPFLIIERPFLSAAGIMVCSTVSTSFFGHVWLKNRFKTDPVFSN